MRRALPEHGRAAVNPPAGRALSLLQDDEVHYNRQPIAVVVADTFEHARRRRGAGRRALRRASRRRSTSTGERARRVQAEGSGAQAARQSLGRRRRGLRAARGARRRDVYTTPMENHNPMEPHATIAHWEGDRLTLYDATQYVSGVRETVAKTLGIPAENVRVIVALRRRRLRLQGLGVVARRRSRRCARRRCERPVKLVARPRSRCSARSADAPQTEQRVALGARARRHARRPCATTSSRIRRTSRTSSSRRRSSTRMLYACPNGIDDAPAREAQHRHADVPARARRSDRHLRARSRRWTSSRTR